MNTPNSAQLFEESKTYFPGGVNSPVRAFRSVGGTPLFMVKGDGCHIFDADHNKYIDFCCSWGPLILGHNHPAIKKSIVEAVENGTSFGAPTIQENQLAKLIIENHPYLERIRFVSSGTEAVMSAIRLARGFTGRDKIVKFEGCYHGHSDALLVKAGSGLVTFGQSSSAGVPKSVINDTLVLPLDNLEALAACFAEHGKDIACVLIEPVPANNGLLLQTRRYLQKLRSLCDEHGALLIFDEVISGFRVGFAGAAGLYRINPDIITFGKIIGGGLPVGAYGARKEIMACISPEGDVYQAGTLSGNPVAMSAGRAAITELLMPNFYRKQTQKTVKFVRAIRKHLVEKNYPFKIFSIGSIFWLSFSDLPRISNSDQISSEKMQLFKRMFHYLLRNGVYLGPSGYEVGFVSSQHSEADLEQAAAIICKGIDHIFEDVI